MMNGETAREGDAPESGEGEREEWTWGEGEGDVNGGEEVWTSSLSPSSEEEEERTDSGYTLLPQDPEPADDIEAEREVSERVSNGHRHGERGGDSDSSCGSEERGRVEAEAAATGLTPRLSRWLDRQVSDLDRETSRGGESGVVRESEEWAKFSEVVPSSSAGDWPPSSAPDGARPVECPPPVQPSSAMEQEEAAAIKKAMAGFSLPTSATPSWAHNVPEAVWKAELISGLKKGPKRRKK